MIPSRPIDQDPEFFEKTRDEADRLLALLREDEVNEPQPCSTQSGKQERTPKERSASHYQDNRNSPRHHDNDWESCDLFDKAMRLAVLLGCTDTSAASRAKSGKRQYNYLLIDEEGQILARVPLSMMKSSIREKSYKKRGVSEIISSLCGVDDNKNAAGVCFAIAFILFLVVASLWSQKSSDKIQDRSSADVDQAATKMDSWELEEYQKAVADANSAILISEHKQAIQGIEKVINQYSSKSDVNLAFMRQLIERSKDKIKDLDQPGKTKYWEGDNYGYQWYDKQPSNGFKMFFVHSSSCASPEIIFGFRVTENGGIIKRYNAKPTTNISTIVIPFQLTGEQWISIESVRCKKN